MNTPYEHGFMLSLLVLAIGGLLWLFTPFIPALFLALLIAIATFKQYNKFQQKLSDSNAALLTTLLVTVVLILPLGYILLISGLEISALIQTINTDFDAEHSKQVLDQIINGLPLSESIKATAGAAISNNLEGFLISIKDQCLSMVTILSTHLLNHLTILVPSKRNS